jgi:hypothetical protein
MPKFKATALNLVYSYSGASTSESLPTQPFNQFHFPPRLINPNPKQSKQPMKHAKPSQQFTRPSSGKALFRYGLRQRYQIKENCEY